MKKAHAEHAALEGFEEMKELVFKDAPAELKKLLGSSDVIDSLLAAFYVAGRNKELENANVMMTEVLKKLEKIKNI